MGKMYKKDDYSNVGEKVDTILFVGQSVISGEKVKKREKREKSRPKQKKTKKRKD